MIDRNDITGLILAGGRGTRMGGTDKGLQPLHGKPMAAHTLARLAPQVGPMFVNANRNLSDYGTSGVPVIADSVPDYAGPLAGMLAGLAHCRTPWMVTAPCDSPFLPADLVVRLFEAIESAMATAMANGTEAPELAIAVTIDAGGKRQGHPVFCLMRTSVRPGLEAFLASGGRKIETWTRSHGLVEVPFPDEAAFANINTLAELRALNTR